MTTLYNINEIVMLISPVKCPVTSALLAQSGFLEVHHAEQVEGYLVCLVQTFYLHSESFSKCYTTPTNTHLPHPPPMGGGPGLLLPPPPPPFPIRPILRP